MVDENRFRKQILLSKIGREGQQKLAESKVLVIGCGALGSVICNNLVRMGIGAITIVDRDFVEWENLHRQILFDEEDVKQNLPKAIAVARKLERINSQVNIKAHIFDVNPGNILDMIKDVNCVIDATDNFETRYLINDACFKQSVPWIYGGVTGTGGMFYAFSFPEKPCLRCMMAEPPTPGQTETCDTVGILPMTVNITASYETTEAIKIILGRKDELLNKMVRFDAWNASLISFGLKPNPDCPLCAHGNYDYLNAKPSNESVTRCGRNAMQISFANKADIDFLALSKILEQSGTTEYNDYLLKFNTADVEISLFKDSRAIIKGAKDEADAKAIFSKYIKF